MKIDNQVFLYYFATGDTSTLKPFNSKGMLVQDTNFMEAPSTITRTLENPIYGGKRLQNYVYDSRKFYISGILMGKDSKELAKVRNELTSIISTVGFKIMIKPQSDANDWGYGTGNSIIFRNCMLLNAGNVFLETANSVSVVKFRLEIECLDGYATLFTGPTTIQEKTAGIEEINEVHYNPAEDEKFIKGIMKQEIKTVIKLNSSGYSGTISLRVKGALSDEKIEAKDIKIPAGYQFVTIDCQSKHLGFFASKKAGDTIEYMELPSFGNFPSGVLPSSDNLIRLYISNPSSVESYKITTRERF